MRDVNGLVSSLSNAYGIVSRGANQTTLALTVNTRTRVTFESTGVTAQGVTAVADSITINQAGVYQVSFSFSGRTAGALTDNIEFRIMKNQTIPSEGGVVFAQMPTNNDSFSATVLYNCSVGDDIALEIRNNSDSDDVVFMSGALTVVRID